MSKKTGRGCNSTDKEKYNTLIEGLKLGNTQETILKSTWLDYLLLMNISAEKGWYSYNAAQIAVIVLSLLIPLIEMTKLNADIYDWNLKVVSIIGFVVAAITTLNRQLGFEQKWRHYRRNAEAMRNEGDDFFALAGKYEKFDSHISAFKEFTKTVTSFKRSEVDSYIKEQKKKEPEHKE